jgi:PAS domain S-box-containing protein
MLWLYLLGIVTILAIVVRRLLRKQQPLNDEVYSWRVAIDHVSSAVAWVPANGRLHSMNPALTQTLGTTAEQLAGRPWLGLFAESDRPRVEQVYSQMLLAGVASTNAATVDAWGIEMVHEVRLVAVHDHKMRFMGHHCIIERPSKDGRNAAHLGVARAQVATPEFATLSS